MWIGVLWAGLRVAMWITHVQGKFRHGLLEKSLKELTFEEPVKRYSWRDTLTVPLVSLKSRERKFSPKFFWPKFLRIPWGRGRPRLRVMPKCLFFFLLWRAWPKSWAGTSARMTRRCLRDILPQNFPLWAAFLGYAKSDQSFLHKVFPNPGRPDPNPGHPDHSLSKTTEKDQLHKVFVWDIPTSGSWMSQEYPAQKLYV